MTDESPNESRRVGKCRSRSRTGLGIRGWLLLAGLWACSGTIRGQESTSNPSAESSTAKSSLNQGRTPRRLPEGLNFANGLFRQRNFELAAEEYERFLKTNPSPEDASDALFGLANARLFQKRYQEAQRAFRKFLAESPDHPRARSAWYRLGEVGYLLGDLAESRRALEKFTEGDATHANLETAWTYLGDVCFALKDLPAATRAYERGLKAYPQGPLVDRTRYGLGRSLAGVGRPDDALKVLEDLARSGKRDWVDRAWLQIGAIHFAAGRFDRAIEAYAALDRESPNSLFRPEAGLRRAEALIRTKRPDDAVPFLKTIADDPSQPLGPQAALTLATVELERKRNQEAVDLLEGAIKRFPSSTLIPSLTFRLGEALARLERFDDARARFLQVAEKFPRDPWAEPAMLRAVKLAFNARDHDTARRLSASFVATFPKSGSVPELQLRSAQMLRADKRAAEAIPILEKLLEEQPVGPEPETSPAPQLTPEQTREARYELALSYRENGQKDKADAVLAMLAKAAVAKDGDKPGTDAITADAQFLVGQAHVEAGRFQEAVGPLEGYLKANPGGEVADVALAHLVTARIGLGEIDSASKALDQLVEKSPKSVHLASTRLRLAEAAMAAKRFDLASAQFRLLADSADLKERGRVQSGLGQALWNLKKPADAAVAFGAALEAEPDDPAAPELALARARALEAAGRLDPALDAYAKVATRYGKSSQAVAALISRARLLTKAGKPAEAASVYEELFKDQARLDGAVASGVSLDTLLCEWGWVQVDAGKIWEADRIFARILKEFPDSQFAADARFNLAESANSAHEHAEVIRLLKPLAETGAKVSPRILPDVLYRLGRTDIAINDWGAAAPVLDRLINEFPNSPRRPEARLFRAEVALQLNDAAGSLANLSALLSEVEGMNDTHSKMFKVLIRRRIVQGLLALKKWDETLAKADALKAELPKGDVALAELDFARGRALQGLARMSEAREAYQAVIEARKGGELAAQARFMRGETFFHEDKLGEARREFLMVDTLHDAPKWQAAALLEVGKVYERLKQWSEAAQYYEILISKFPADPNAAEAKGYLQAAIERSKSTGKGGSGTNGGDRKEDISARVGQE